MFNGEKLGAFIVPTGIGASIGGYAGDAGSYARKISKKCQLIVNPNVVNAACFSAINENMLYVEGFTLDEFFKGNCFLQKSNNNKIGVIFDKAISEDVLNIHINTINATKVVYGLDIPYYEITEENVGVEFFIDKTGSSHGNVSNLSTLKKSACKLVDNGCKAIAIVCHFPECSDDGYSDGIGADPVGGVEAIISHFISKELKVPCAHSPAFDDFSVSTKIVNPKCAAEYITPTFLPCILIGLSNAPLIKNESFQNNISINNLDFVIVPHNALGSIPVIKMHNMNKKIFAVKENSTVLNVNCSNFEINCDIINTYDEIVEYLND